MRKSDFCEAKRSFVPSETATERERRGVQGWRECGVAKEGAVLADSGRMTAWLAERGKMDRLCADCAFFGANREGFSSTRKREEEEKAMAAFSRKRK